MAGYLTTHVLDTARGMPAAGIAIDLFRIDATGRHLVASAVSNADGRTDAPMLARAEFAAGVYELLFHAGPYFAATYTEGASGAPRFLDMVPVRFGVTDAAHHVHVPLLLSPFGYSTYRGS